jgi:hypothetical protein
MTETTFYRWRKKYGGMDVSDARRLKQLEDENRRLKRLVADQALNLLWAFGGTGRTSTPGIWVGAHALCGRLRGTARKRSCTLVRGTEAGALMGFEERSPEVAVDTGLDFPHITAEEGRILAETLLLRGRADSDNEKPSPVGCDPNFGRCPAARPGFGGSSDR